MKSKIKISKRKEQRKKFKKYFKANWPIYAFLIPGILFSIIFKYVPMFGITIAFKDYNIFLGNNPIEAMILSPWVGFEHFNALFSSPKFWQVLWNTIIISVYKIVFLFPLPIILAILLNEVRLMWFKRGVQTIVYLPHFLSWVICAGLFVTLLGAYGPINQWLMKLSIVSEPIKFFTNSDLFRGLLVTTAGWKETGWNTIIYLAAITAIDPGLYEAARIDGANKLQQIRHITLPGIANTIVMLLILRIGAILDAGFDQIFNMYSPFVYNVSDIISTFVYRIGLGQMEYSFSTAVGLFNSVVALILILSANKITTKYFNRGIW